MSSSSSMSSSISSTISTMQPFEIPKDDDIVGVQKFLKESTERIDGADLREADIIFCGDIHTEDDWQNYWRGWVIDHFGGPSPIILVEGAAFGKRVSQRVCRFVSQKQLRWIFGWDDMPVSDSAMKAISAKQKLCEKYNTIGPTEKWSNDDLFMWVALQNKRDLQDQLRTESMIKCVRSFLGNKKKVIVIAGSDHIYDDKNKYNVLDYFKGLKVAVVCPKSLSSDSEKESYTYAKKLLESDSLTNSCSHSQSTSSLISSSASTTT